jgi:predicted amidohydrolase YtcJ
MTRPRTDRPAPSPFPFRLVAAAAGLLLAAGSAWSAPPQAPVPAPDVIYLDGKFVTLDPRGSVASAVAVKEGRFVAVGSTEALRKLAGPSTRMVNLLGKTVVPGLVDAHSHPVPTMVFTTSVDARAPGVPSVAKAVSNLAERARTTPPGEWIFLIGASASQTKFAEKRLPSKAELDRAAPDNPVWFWNGTHGEVLNSRALAALGVTRAHPSLPHGGHVILDASGEPTGEMFEAEGNVPALDTPQLIEAWLRKDIPALWNSHGVTTLEGMFRIDEAVVLRQVAASGFRPSIRYVAFVYAEPNGVGLPRDLGELRMPAGAPAIFFRTGGVKLWVDGEVDAGSGLCAAPYADPAGVPNGGRGLQVSTQAQVDDFADRASAAGLGAGIHATCDAAYDVALSAFQKAAAKGRPRTLQRMEHYGQFMGLTPDQKKVVRDLGLRVVTQPSWLLFLGRSTYHLLGEPRASTGFRYGTMVKEGLMPAGSSDTTGVYLQAIDPFLAMKTAVTRMSDVGPIQPEEALSVEDALRMWTIWGARSLGLEDERGSIEPGKLADMAVLSDDLLTIAPARIDTIRVLQTVVGGEVVYRAR